MVIVTGYARTADVSGGEGRWLARRRAGYDPTVRGDRDHFEVGDDGWASDHTTAAAALEGSMSFYSEGFAVDPDGERLAGEKLGELPPALQLQARARRALPEDTPVHSEWPPKTRKETHINLHMQRRNAAELASWQARIRATAVYSGDGARLRRGEEGLSDDERHVVARATIRHDGVVLGGRMREPEGADNYLAELAALLDAINSENIGGRIIVIFDASSPVLARMKLQRMSNRFAQNKYAGEWLSALSRLMHRQEVVVFLWQK